MGSWEGKTGGRLGGSEGGKGDESKPLYFYVKKMSVIT